MDRRRFLAALTLGAGGIFAPRFGRWFRQGGGTLWVPETGVTTASFRLTGPTMWYCFTGVHAAPSGPGWEEVVSGVWRKLIAGRGVEPLTSGL
jgi:hypothetical protein